MRIGVVVSKALDLSYNSLDFASHSKLCLLQVEQVIGASKQGSFLQGTNNIGLIHLNF